LTSPDRGMLGAKVKAMALITLIAKAWLWVMARAEGPRMERAGSNAPVPHAPPPSMPQGQAHDADRGKIEGAIPSGCEAATVGK
jgi:hypothetical protein